MKEKVIQAMKKVFSDCGKDIDEDLLRLLDAYYSGNISTSEILKMYWRNKTITFKDAFQEAERLGNILEVYIYNTNRKFITDTPYYEGSFEYFKSHVLYTSETIIERFLIDDGVLFIYYYKNR